MTRAWMFAAVIAVTGTAVVGQQTAARTSDRVQLETAINKEIVDGDLTGAIAIYRTLVDSPDRSVRAQALLKLGQGYTRLSDPQATATLERVLEFTDQPELVAGARAALGRAGQGRQGGAVRTVLVNTRDENIEYPAVSADGKYVAYTDYNANANLVVRDLATGLAKQLTTNAVAPGTEIYDKTFSRDGRRLAYTFDYGELRIIDVNLTASQPPAVRTVYNPDRGFVTPYDWSADGKRIALQVVRGSEIAQIGYVTVDDGEFHVLRSLAWQGSSRLSLSADGAHLAYDRPSEASGERDVFVLTTDGKRETAIARRPGRDAVVGWSTDDRHLLFISEKDGINDLWAQPMRNGRPSGTPVMLRSNVSPSPVGITVAGDVYFHVEPSTVGIYVAPFDAAAGRIGPPGRTRIVGQRPEWSPDGTMLAHSVPRNRAIIGITTVSTGRTREVLVKDLQYIQDFSWSPDGRSIIAKGSNLQSGAGLFRIDPRTGDVVTVALQEPEAEKYVIWGQPSWWRDSASIAYVKLRTNSMGRLPGIREPGADAPRLIERVLSSSEPRELVDFSREPWATFGLTVSPDRRFVASRGPGPGEAGGGSIRGRGAYQTDPRSFVVIHTVGTGEVRRIWEAPFAQAFSGTIEWLPDSSAVLVTRRTEQGGSRFETYLVPLGNGAPRRLEGGPQNLLAAGLRLAPDGRRVAMLAGDVRPDELQIFERIIPSPRSR